MVYQLEHSGKARRTLFREWNLEFIFFANIRFGLIPLCRADDCMKHEAFLSAD